jgi:heavy-metal resistance protein
VRRWWVVIALLLSVGVNLGLVAAVATRKLADRGDPPRPVVPGRPPGMPKGPEGEPLPQFRRLADRLGLEGEPRRRFLDLQRQLFEETLRVRMRQTETHREVRRELMSPEPDQGRIDVLLQQAARDYLTLEQALSKNVLATRSILTPDQEEEYLRIIAWIGPRLEGMGQQQPQRRRLPPFRQRNRLPRDRNERPPIY